MAWPGRVVSAMRRLIRSWKGGDVSGPLTERVGVDGVAETAMIALRRSGGQMRFTRTMIGCLILSGCCVEIRLGGSAAGRSVQLKKLCWDGERFASAALLHEKSNVILYVELPSGSLHSAALRP